MVVINWNTIKMLSKIRPRLSGGPKTNAVRTASKAERYRQSIHVLWVVGVWRPIKGLFFAL